MPTAVIIVAAGRGSRAGGGVPKQWRELAGRRVVDWSLDTFAAHPAIDQIVLVVSPDSDPADWPTDRHPDLLVAYGGDTRAASVLAGLEVLAGMATTRVLIHDAARPGVSVALVDNILSSLDDHDGAAPAISVSDALWRGQNGLVNDTADRRDLFRAQTPQGFRFDAILAAHRAHGGDATDDVAVARAAGLSVAIVEGEERNMKITGAGDFNRAAQLLGEVMDIRTGNGFDVHRFGDGDQVTLCGVTVPHDRGLMGHSDADVGMHAVTDAVYGALAAGDIGQHFPPSDPQWKGAASDIFLRHACDMARDAGYRISHADCTLICEEPKIGPHATDMRTAMAGIMGLSADQVSVKATTSEQLGFTGRGEGIAAQATATLVKP